MFLRCIRSKQSSPNFPHGRTTSTLSTAKTRAGILNGEISGEQGSSQKGLLVRDVFSDLCKRESIRIPKLQWVESEGAYDVLEESRSERGGNLSWPILRAAEQNLADGAWMRISRRKCQELFAKRKANGDLQSIINQDRILPDVLPLTVWIDKKYSATEYGTAICLKVYFGETESFRFPEIDSSQSPTVSA